MSRDDDSERDRARDQQKTAVGAGAGTDREVPSTVEGTFYEDAFFDADLVRS